MTTDASELKFKIKATKKDGTQLDVDTMLRGGNDYASVEDAMAVAEAFERTYMKFEVVNTPEGKSAVVGKFSTFGNGPDGKPVETVNQVTMRSYLEPCVFDDKAIADMHCGRLNDMVAMPVFVVYDRTA